MAAKRSVDARPAPALEDTFDPNDLFGAAGPIDESFGLDDMPAGAYATTAPDLDDMPVLGLSGGDLSGLDEMIAQTGVQVQQQIANAANARRLLLADVQKSITAPLPKRPPSAAYRVHLLMVATAMSLLPLLYVALVIAVGLGVVMYVIYGIPAAFSHSPRGRVGLLYALIVITPVIAGSILTLFMIKPLFFRIRSEGRRRSLTKQGEPMLFELVEKICEATGAPKPQRIDVDYQVNASASPQGGVFSAAAGKMVLTIGVPLLAGLSARQLAGVLAHEFGHFSQRMGMTTSIIIRKVNFWFARVVYQRDTFDETLDEWGQSEDWRIGLIVGVTKLCIMVSRGILWCFMMLGYLLSAGLMRQMEYDADRYEYGLVGHKTFRETAISLRLLSAAHAGVMDVMYQIFLKGHLADNMAMLGEHMMNTMPTDVREKLKRSVREEKTGLLDTHPSDQARIERAEQSGENGVFVLEVPARELLRHYEALCKNVTWDFYRDHLGNQIQPSQMTPTKQFVEALLRS